MERRTGPRQREYSNGRSRQDENNRRNFDVRGYNDYDQRGEHHPHFHAQQWHGHDPRQEAPYMSEQNFNATQGGRAYGQNYGQARQGRNFDPRDERFSGGFNNGQQDQYSGARSRGDSFAQNYGQHRRGASGFPPQQFDDGGYNNQYHNPYDERGDFRRDEWHNDVRQGTRGWRDDREDEPRYGFRRFYAEEGPWREDPLQNEHHRDGYQVSGDVEGFGWRESRQHDGGWVGEDEYRGGHAQSRRGRGKYGSR